MTKTSRGFLLPSNLLFSTVLLSACLLLHHWLVGSVLAQSPLPKGVSGHRVTLQDNWCVADSGYKPIRFTIANDPPVGRPDEQRFTVSVTKKIRRTSPEVNTGEIIIPAGNLSGSVEIYVNMSMWASMRSGEFLVERGDYEGNFDRKDLLRGDLYRGSNQAGIPSTMFVSSIQPQTNSQRSWTCYSGSFSVGTVNDTPRGVLPSFDKMIEIYLNNKRGAAGNTTAAMAIIQSPGIHFLHPSNLPKKWIGLTSLDRIMISFADLKAICLKNPTQRTNIEKWVAAGGLLIVLEPGRGFSKANEILAPIVRP